MLLTTEIENAIGATRNLLEREGFTISGGKLINGNNQSVKLMRGLMRLRKSKDCFAVVLGDFSESDIEVIANGLAVDQFSWTQAVAGSVERAYSTQFAFAHKLLLSSKGDNDRTLFNIQQFSNRVRSCMTPDPCYVGRESDMPMDCAVRVWRCLDDFDSEITAFYDKIEDLAVKANVVVRRNSDDDSLTIFRFLTWESDDRCYVDKIYHNGARTDVESFKDYFDSHCDKSVYFREHNHLVDSDDSDGVGFSLLGSRLTTYPDFNVDMCNIDRLPYIDSFRYFDTVRDTATFTCQPSDESEYAADSCSGYWNEYTLQGSAVCGCCGERCEEDELLHTELDQVSDSGYVCDNCYCEHVGCCDGCGCEVALQYETYVNIRRIGIYGECCATVENN